MAPPQASYYTDSSDEANSSDAEVEPVARAWAEGGVTPCCKQLLDPRLALMASVLLSHLRGRDLMEHRQGPVRRVVSGLREVSQLLRTTKQPVLAVFIAYDIAEKGPAGSRLGCPARQAEMVMTAALQASAPVSFALSRQDMGSALGHQRRKVSATAVLDATGEEVLFSNVMSLSVDLCVDFVNQVGALTTNNLVRPLLSVTL